MVYETIVSDAYAEEQPEVRKKKEYGDLNYEWLNKTLDVSAISFHKMLQIAEKKEVLKEVRSEKIRNCDLLKKTAPYRSGFLKASPLREILIYVCVRMIPPHPGG